MIKTLFVQGFLYYKLGKRNILGINCQISKDLKIGANCNIRNYVTIGRNVILNDGISIGSNAKVNNIVIGKNSQIEGGVVCTGYGDGKIKIGEESYIGLNNVLDWSDNITIGNNVHIAGPSTSLWTHSSAKQAFAGLPLKDKNLKHRPTAPIVIESNVYIGGNCTIYPGITIEHHSVIAPNSAVTHDVKSYTMVGGVPAKLIKHLDQFIEA
jgi:acetyltransferase-like isoleucine patch superfamily enzyme